MLVSSELLQVSEGGYNIDDYVDKNIIIYVLQLCVWSTDGWEKQASKFLQIPAGRTPAPLAQTRVQFHQDQIHLLAVHETQLAVYEAPKLECLKQVSPIDQCCAIVELLATRS